MKWLKEQGADINARRGDGWTPLFAAASMFDGSHTGRARYVMLKLIEHGADINAKDNAGKTALFWAAKHDDGYGDYAEDQAEDHAVVILMEYGADVDDSDPELSENIARLQYERRKMLARVPATAAMLAEWLDAPLSKVVTVVETADRKAFENTISEHENRAAVRCESPHFDDAWLDMIVGDDLLAFSNTSVNPQGLTSAGVAKFGRCQNLRLLAVCSANAIDEDVWVSVAENCTNLEFLQICDSHTPQTSRAFFNVLSKCTKMKQLRLRGMPEDAYEVFFACLAKMPELIAVTFQDTVNFPEDMVKRFVEDRPEVTFVFERVSDRRR